MDALGRQRIVNAAIRTDHQVLLAGGFQHALGIGLDFLFAAGIKKRALMMVKAAHQGGAGLKEGAPLRQACHLFHMQIPVYGFVIQIFPDGKVVGA